MTIRELLAGETGRAFEAMLALRTHLTDEGEFARRVDDLQRPQGYRHPAGAPASDCSARLCRPPRSRWR